MILHDLVLSAVTAMAKAKRTRSQGTGSFDSSSFFVLKLQLC